MIAVVASVCAFSTAFILLIYAEVLLLEK